MSAGCETGGQKITTRWRFPVQHFASGKDVWKRLQLQISGQGSFGDAACRRYGFLDGPRAAMNNSQVLDDFGKFRRIAG